MSSLLYYTTGRDILVAMDTLAVCEEGEPLLFTTKFYPVPHLGGLICGTGLGAFVAAWFVRVNTGQVAEDLVQLDLHAPRVLRELARTPAYKDLFATHTVTIYHLGFPAAGGPPCIFAYRSERGFASERLPVGGLTLKPWIDLPAPWEFPRDFARAMQLQREGESQKPTEKRVHIGGDIFVCHLTAAGMVIHRFASFPRPGRDGGDNFCACRAVRRRPKRAHARASAPAGRITVRA